MTEKKYSPLPAREKAGAVLAWLEEHKARDVVALDLGGISPLTDVIVIVSASSVRHAQSLADGLMALCAQENYEFFRLEGYQAGLWILADLNDIVVHIFQEPTRELYQLETLWRNALPLHQADLAKAEEGA